MKIIRYIYISDVYLTIIIIVVFSMAYSIFEKIQKNTTIYKYIVKLLFVCYVALVLYVTIFSRQRYEQNGYNLIPFYSYYLALTTQPEKLRESIMNVLFFYPLGYLFGSFNIQKLNSKRWTIIPISCGLSIFIELSQFIFKLGYAEVDDVIHNTLGCAIGLGVCILFERLFEINNDGKRNE